MKEIISQNPYRRAMEAKGAIAENASPRKNAILYNWKEQIRPVSGYPRE